MSTTSISSFTRYRRGYDDGYFGREKSFPDDKDYIMGYEEGHEADQAGEPNKYAANNDGSW